MLLHKTPTPNHLPTDQENTILKFDFQRLADTTFQRCQELAKFSQAANCMDRRYLTKQHKLANAQVAAWMEQAGMTTWQDAVGNICGKYVAHSTTQTTEANSPPIKTLLIGSHLDTVPNGGKYDGILGVLVPLAVLQYCHDENIQFPFHIEIIGFCDEEGTRFGTTLLGSRALTGNWQQEWASLTDEHGVSLAQAMQDFGLDFARVAEAKRDSESLLGFYEVHIEQGPVLEAKQLPVGVVTSIAGAKRLQINVSGMAGHAGTVPMEMRQDALVASAKMITQIANIAEQQQLVATVGQIQSFPGAVNVIPGKAVFSLDIRSESDAIRDQALNAIFAMLQSVSNDTGTQVTWQQTHHADAVACDETLQTQLRAAIAAQDMQPLSLFSGAGHDAMEIAQLCPMSMLFVRCAGGISHHPAEAITVEDTQYAIETSFRFIESLASKF